MNETKTPRHELSTILADYDSLEAMQKSDGETADQGLYEELQADIIKRAEALASEHPEQLTIPSPATLRLRALLGHRANQAAQTDFLPPASDYREGAFYKRLDAKQQELVDRLLEQMLDEDTLLENSNVVDSPQEAASRLDLETSEVEQAYGLLSAIQDKLDPGDNIEFITVRFEEDPGTTGGTKTTPTPTAHPGGLLAESYIGRVRRSSTNKLVSIVLDAVPPKYGNAVYVLRNDDSSIDNLHATTRSKPEMRARGSRRVTHNDKTGTDGVLKRINHLLNLPFDNFRRIDDAE